MKKEAYENIIRELQIKDFAIESSINGIAFSDLNANVTYVNEACLKMWGGALRSELVGKKADFFALNKKEAEQVIVQVITKGSWEGEIWGRRRDGSPICVYLSAFLVTDRDNSPVCMMCSFIDITDRKKIEQEMKVKDLAIESSINAVVIGDLEGKITYVNKAFLKEWGGTKEEVLGTSLVDFALDKNAANEALEALLKKGKWQGELSGINKHGEIKHVELSAHKVDDANGNPICLFCTFVDITEKKLYETWLENAKKELEKKVKERTKSVIDMNRQLIMEINERKNIEAKLRKKEKELKIQAKNLKEMNTTLKVLLEHKQKEREEMERKFLSNIKDLVLPYVKELKSTQLSIQQQGLLDLIENNLINILAPFSQKVSANFYNFTPSQLKVAEFIKMGKTTKEIAEIMNISTRAVEFHRNQIREKLGIKHKKINLRTYLQSLD
ncbi:hypothetical protein JCM13304A_06500 [Desulfothermus okinawensis JCM 13304]